MDRIGVSPDNVVIMDFSGVYDYESFALDHGYRWLDCRHLSGTDCYCDEEGSSSLRKLISDCPVHGIHFIDSGNYHYVTKFWTDRIRVPFTLVVFDHHPDMQPPLFENLLSCGSWVKDVADNNEYCRRIVVVGASDSLVRSVPAGYEDKVRFYSDSDLANKETWKKFAAEHITDPVYVSVDKDVMSPEYAITNWDQGSMTLDDLCRLLKIIFSHHEIAGMDVCGEFRPGPDLEEDEREAMMDGLINETLLRLVSA